MNVAVLGQEVQKSPISSAPCRSAGQSGARRPTVHKLRLVHKLASRACWCRTRAQAGGVGHTSDRHQLKTIVSQRGPVVLLRDADAAGISRAVVRRLFDRGDLVRLAKAAFAPTTVIETASPWEIFRLKSVAFGRSSGPDTYLTGAAAAAVLRLPMVSEPPDLPTAIRPGNAHLGHDHTPYGRSRHGHLPVQHRTRRDGVATVSPAYCAVDVARHFGSQDGLVITDNVLAAGVSREVLARLVADLDRYPGIGTARWVVEHADPRAESPLETLGRLAFLGAGLTHRSRTPGFRFATGGTAPTTCYRTPE